MFGSSIVFTKRAGASLSPCRYSSGTPVHGTLVVSVSLASGPGEPAPPSVPVQTKEVIFRRDLPQHLSADLQSSNCSSSQIYGSTQFFFSKDLLQRLYSSPGISSFHLAAGVTDSSTGSRRLQLSPSLCCLLHLVVFLSPKV